MTDAGNDKPTPNQKVSEDALAQSEEQGNITEDERQRAKVKPDELEDRQTGN